MKRESQLVENQTQIIGINQSDQKKDNLVQDAQENETPVTRCVQDQVSQQQRNIINQPQMINNQGSLKDLGISAFQVQRERKSTFSRQFKEQLQSVGAEATVRQEEEDKINSKQEYLNDEINPSDEEQSKISQKIINSLKNGFQLLYNFFSNKVQQFQNKDMESKYIQYRLESTFDSYICIQSSLILSYLALFVINISKGEFSNQLNSTQQNSSDQNKSSIENHYHNSLIEVIWQLIIAIFNLGLICISKSERLSVRGILIMFQLAELVNLDRLLFGDINDYIYDSFTNTSSSTPSTTDGQNYINNIDTYLELRYELIKSFVMMIGCFLFIKNMIGWNFRLLYSLMLICAFGIILYHENSFWLFLTSLIILSIVFNYYYYFEEKKSRISFAELYSHQDKNSPSLYNMIHEQISSGLIVVSRNTSEDSNEQLQLKFANKISIEQLQCNKESDILQKFKEISVKSELNKSEGDSRSQGDTSSFDINSKVNKDDQLKNQQEDGKHNSNSNSNQTLYDKLVQYIEDIIKAQQEQQKLLNEQNNMMSIHSLKNQKNQSYQPGFVNKIKNDQNKKTNSMIQLGKSIQRVQRRQNSSTPFNNSKIKMQTPQNHNSTLIKANYSSNLIQGNNIKQIQSEIAIQYKNQGNSLQQKTNQNTQSGKAENNNTDLQLNKKTSFINVNAIVNSFTPKNNIFHNGISPIRGKSTPGGGGGDEALYESQNRAGSNTKIKILQSALSNNNSPDRKKNTDKKNDKSSFGQLIYGVLKSSNQESQQKYEVDQVIVKEQNSNQKDKISSNQIISGTPKQQKYLKKGQKGKENHQLEEESCNIKDEQIQSIDKNINTLHLGSNHICQLIKSNKKGITSQNQQESSSNSSSSLSEESPAKDKNIFNSTIQVQLPTSEINFQQFDFKINLIEWDNSPALIILVTETTEKLVNEKLRELEMYKEELLYTMQHISRTPLNSIINLSDLMLNEYSKQYRITSSQRHIMNIHSILNSNGQIGNNIMNNNLNNQQQNNIASLTFNTANNQQYLRQTSTNSQTNIFINQQNNNTNNTPSAANNNYPSLNQHFSSINVQQQFESQLQNNQPFNNLNNNANSISPLKIQHQTSNPNVNGMSELQEQQLNELESVVQNLHIIKNNGLILLHTINTVTDLSYFQTNQGKLNIDPESFSLQNIIEEIQDLYLHQIQEKKLQFYFNIPNYLDRIFSDKKRVLQVLFEIIGNAIKYTNSGSIQVKIKEQEKGLIWVKVQDTGQGMSESQKHSLFSNKLIQYYSRERDFSKKNSAGLGLDFSRKVVGILGPFHEIFIKSSEGVGSAFKFLLYSDYKIKNKVDIHELKHRLQTMQIQNNDDLGGGIFTPDIFHSKKNEQLNFFSQNQQITATNISQLPHPQSSNQILMKKANDAQHPQSAFQINIKRGSHIQAQNINNSKNQNISDFNDFNGAISDVVEGESQSNNKIVVQNNTKKDTEHQLFNAFSGEKSNLSYLKQSQPKMEKYISLEYDTNQKYRFPQSAQLKQVSTFDHEGSQSIMIAGLNKKKKKNQNKGQHFTPQHAFHQQQRIVQIISDNKNQQSEQRIPCIEINEDIEQKYNGGEGDIDSNFKSLDLNKDFKQNHSQDSQNKSHKIDQNNYSTRNIDDSTVQNQNSNNQNFNQLHKQSFVIPFNHEIKEQNNLQQVHINSYMQNIHESPQIQSQRLNHSQIASEDSCITVGAINNLLHQSQSVDQSSQIPKRVYYSTSTKPNNLKQLGPSIFLQRYPQSQEHNNQNQQFLSIPLQKPNLFNFNFLSHQRIEINQVVNKNNVIDDLENQEPPHEQSLIDHGSPGIHSKHESIYIDQMSPHPKLGYKVQSQVQHQNFQQIQQQQSPQNNQQLSQLQQYQPPSSPFKRIRLERKETKNSTIICQTLKIDDYQTMLNHVFPEKSYVLGVDDNTFNLLILEQTFLKCSNIIFHKASNGVDALEKVKALKSEQNESYKLFLLDIQMPIMDGYKTHTELKKLMKKKIIQQSPVFAVTAYANEKQICLQEGMEGFVEKPVSIKLLINLMYDYFVKKEINHKKIHNNNS